MENSTARRRKGPTSALRVSHRCFSLGVCAMANKVESRTMQCILKRLQKSYDFDIVQFTERMILHADVSEWPKVDCLIAFHSTGYPLEKVSEIH